MVSDYPTMSTIVMFIVLYSAAPVISLVAGVFALIFAIWRPSWRRVLPRVVVAIIAGIVPIGFCWGVLGWSPAEMIREEPGLVLLLFLPIILGVLALIICGVRRGCGCQGEGATASENPCCQSDPQ